MKCTSAELVFGTSLRLPGDFFASSTSFSTPYAGAYITTLQWTIKKLHATPRISQWATYVSPSLSLCIHGFIRHDAVRKPSRLLMRSLQSPGSFMVDINGHKSNIFLDRLKPAYYVLNCRVYRPIVCNR